MTESFLYAFVGVLISIAALLAWNMAGMWKDIFHIKHQIRLLKHRLSMEHMECRCAVCQKATEREKVT